MPGAPVQPQPPRRRSNTGAWAVLATISPEEAFAKATPDTTSEVTLLGAAVWRLVQLQREVVRTDPHDDDADDTNVRAVDVLRTSAGFAKSALAFVIKAKVGRERIATLCTPIAIADTHLSSAVADIDRITQEPTLTLRNIKADKVAARALAAVRGQQQELDAVSRQLLDEFLKRQLVENANEGDDSGEPPTAPPPAPPQSPGAVWSDYLAPAQWALVFGVRKENAPGERLRELEKTGDAEMRTTKSWRVKLSALTPIQLQRLNELLAKPTTSLAKHDQAA